MKEKPIGISTTDSLIFEPSIPPFLFDIAEKFLTTGKKDHGSLANYFSKCKKISQDTRAGLRTLQFLQDTLNFKNFQKSLPLVDQEKIFQPERCFLKSNPATKELILPWVKDMLAKGSGILGKNNLVEVIESAKNGEKILGLGRHLELAGILFLRLIFEELNSADFFNEKTIFFTGQKLSTETIIPTELLKKMTHADKNIFLYKYLKNHFPKFATDENERSLLPTLMRTVNEFRYFTKRDNIDRSTNVQYLKSLINYIKEKKPWENYNLSILYPMAGCERDRGPEEVDENFINMIFRGTPLTPKIDKIFLFNEGGQLAAHGKNRGDNILDVKPQITKKRMSFGKLMSSEELLGYLCEQKLISDENKTDFINSKYKDQNLTKEIAIAVEKAIRGLPLEL